MTAREARCEVLVLGGGPAGSAAAITAVGLETEVGPISAGVVVDSTGRWRALSRWLGLPWLRRGPDRIAWYGYATGPLAGRQDTPSLRADARGWTWAARVRPQTWAWTRL